MNVYLRSVLTAVAAPLLVLVGGSSAADDDDLIRHMFDLAKKGDVAAIEKLERDVTETTPRLRLATAIALYTAAPGRFTDRLVATFPDDANGVMGLAYEGLELKQDERGPLTPEFLFSFSALAEIAMTGHEQGINRFLVVTANSEGVVAEHLCEKMLIFMTRRPGAAMDGLLEVSPAARAAIIGKCLDLASMNEAASAREAVAGVRKLGADLETELAPLPANPGKRSPDK
jgi:hypothetical protein